MRYRYTIFFFLFWLPSLYALEPVTEETYNRLVHETRCMTCPNQSIADSQSPFSLHLKAEILQAVEQGKTETEIRKMLIERYGDKISYRPSYTLLNAPLWGLPALLVLIAGIRFVRQRKRQA